MLPFEPRLALVLLSSPAFGQGCAGLLIAERDQLTQYVEVLKKQEQRFADIDRVDQALDADIMAKRQAAEQLARQLTF